MDPAILASTLATSGLLSKGSDVLQALIGLLKDRASGAERTYQLADSDPEDPIEKRRDECLLKIQDIQQNLVCRLSNTDLAANLIPMFLQNIGDTYEATTKRQLDLIQVNLSGIEDAIRGYERDRQFRRNVRFGAVLFTLGCLGVLGCGLWYGKSSGVTGSSTIAILDLPVPVVLWSAIGSFAAILYRFTNAGDDELDDPLRWLFSRPLTGVIMGSISFLILKVGLMTVTPVQGAAVELGNKESMWLIAFLAGFSDRFSDGLLRSLVGRFGGDKDGTLVSMTVATQDTRKQGMGLGLLQNFRDFISRGTSNPQPAVVPASAPVAGADDRGVHRTPAANGAGGIDQALVTTRNPALKDGARHVQGNGDTTRGTATETSEHSSQASVIIEKSS